jgi:superfamily I DNA and/or RNA helicase
MTTLILNLSLAKERTLVCSIANVAVNSLTHKYLERVEYYKKINSNYTLKRGECIRIGHVSDDKLRENDLIFPEENLYLIFLREKLNKLIKLRKKYEDLNDENEKAKVISQINENEIKIMEELRKHIHNAYVVFSTSSRAILDNNLGNCQFDNIIIDECSMMAIPNLLAMLKRISKRVIIAGDFRQLGPIALSSTTASEMWLHNDLFCLVDPDQSKLSKYDCVKMLKTQWRSNKDIIEYSNKYFYQSNLVTKPGIGGEKAFPVIQKNLRVEFIDLTLNSEYKCERTKSQSRRNLLSAQATFSLLKELRNASDIKNVGVITPYNGQCSYYKRFISENRMLFPSYG